MNYTSDQHTAILLFARSAKEEALYKKLSYNVSDNILLLDSLKQYACSVANHSELPLFHFCETQQTGESFGERLTNSMANVFGQGFNSVIVIGADCPDISVADIRSAEEALRAGQMVIGPDSRGGTFLFGLTAEMFKKQQLTKVSWQTSELLDSLSSYAKHFQYEITYLDQKFDLNEATDVLEYSGQSSVLRNLLRQLMHQVDFLQVICLYQPYLIYLKTLSRRGPPVAGTTY